MNVFHDVDGLLMKRIVSQYRCFFLHSESDLFYLLPKQEMIPAPYHDGGSVCP